jgi:glycosyltransferase involved in cell wall biosynthesis
MSISFCIITNGKRPDLLETVIASIRIQNIPEHEIIVAGRYHRADGVVYLPAEAAAEQGRLGEMRNRAVERTRHDYVAMLDDDIILSPDWYATLSAYGRPFDILTSRIRLPDGGRYYDHATAGGPRGQAFLDDDEDDAYVYMTGGGGWVMRRYVAENVCWDVDRAFYQEEDIDFSRRCQAAGYTIVHNPVMVVYHADPTYTNIGRALKRRKAVLSQEWVLHELDGLNTLQILKRVVEFKRHGLSAEAADYVRMAILLGKNSWLFKTIWQAFLLRVGGDLPDTYWSPSGDPDYVRLLTTLQGNHEFSGNPKLRCPSGKSV